MQEEPSATMEEKIQKFHKAVAENNSKLVEQLLASKELSPDEPHLENNCNPPILIATCKGHVKVISILIENGCDVNMSNAQGWTALHEAVHRHNYKSEIAEQFLQHEHANWNQAESINGLIPLHIFVKNLTNKAKLMESDIVILSKITEKSDVNYNTFSKNTALHLATKGKNDLPCIAEKLIAAGINIDAQNNLGETALHCAVDKAHAQMFETLLSCGADAKLGDRFHQSVAHYCAMKNSVNLMEILLQKTSDQSSIDLNGDTALHIAAGKGSVQMAKMLVQAGIDLNVENRKGKTPLEVSVEGGFADVVQVLLSAKCNISANPQSVYKFMTIVKKDLSPCRCSLICELLLNAIHERGVVTIYKDVQL